eukprot:02017.XXX_20625_20792_1 [CDS] Oithona nana genome sequencing.
MEYEKKSNEGYTMADETRSVDWDHSCIMPSSFCIVIHSSHEYGFLEHCSRYYYIPT